MKSKQRFLGGLVLLGLLTGCNGSEGTGGQGDACKVDLDCEGSLQCIAQVCWLADCPDRRCLDGWACIAGECLSPDCWAVECGPDQACAGGSCYPIDCDTRPCPGIGEVCIDEDCTPASCLEVECPEGQSCANGRCYPEDCDTHECPGYGEVCIEDTCTQRSCVGVSCPPGQECANGYCYPANCEPACAPGLVCADATCLEPSCVGVACPPDQLCANGRCWPTGCAGQPCPDGQVCDQDRCVLPECVDGRCCPDAACTALNTCSHQVCPDGIHWCTLLDDVPAWTQQTPVCDDGDACTQSDTCQLDGSCQGEPVTCLDPPASGCLDAVWLRTYDAEGTCAAGSCEYGFQDTACDFGCQDDACLDCQPDCTGLACGPDPICGAECGPCPAGSFCTRYQHCHQPDFELLEIPAGDFEMGSPPGEVGRDDYTGYPEGSLDETLHPVELTHRFLMSDTEISQGDFEAMLGYLQPHFATCGATCPVEWISWHEAAAFCNQLSVGSGLPTCFDCQGALPDVTCSLSVQWASPYLCPGYRLPTEAEWEYAARAGTQTATHGGDIWQAGCSPVDSNLNVIGWYLGNARAAYADAAEIDCDGTGLMTGTQPVRGKAPNGFGLYDMAGNVWEWVMDCALTYPAGPQVDPIGPLCAGTGHIFRGGGVGNAAVYCRHAERAEYPGYDDRGIDIGLRPVRSLDVPSDP